MTSSSDYLTTENILIGVGVIVGVCIIIIVTVYCCLCRSTDSSDENVGENEVIKGEGKDYIDFEVTVPSPQSDESSNYNVEIPNEVIKRWKEKIPNTNRSNEIRNSDVRNASSICSDIETGRLLITVEGDIVKVESPRVSTTRSRSNTKDSRSTLPPGPGIRYSIDGPTVGGGGGSSHSLQHQKRLAGSSTGSLHEEDNSPSSLPYQEYTSPNSFIMRRKLSVGDSSYVSKTSNLDDNESTSGDKSRSLTIGSPHMFHNNEVVLSPSTSSSPSKPTNIPMLRESVNRDNSSRPSARNMRTSVGSTSSRLMTSSSNPLESSRQSTTSVNNLTSRISPTQQQSIRQLSATSVSYDTSFLDDPVDTATRQQPSYSIATVDGEDNGIYTSSTMNNQDFHTYANTSNTISNTVDHGVISSVHTSSKNSGGNNTNIHSSINTNNTQSPHNPGYITTPPSLNRMSRDTKTVTAYNRLSMNRKDKEKYSPEHDLNTQTPDDISTVTSFTDLDTTNPNTNLLLNKIEIGDTTKMKRKSYVKQLIDNNHIFDWLGGGGGGGGGESSSATSSPERHTIPINDQEDEKQVQSAETQQHDNTYQTTTTNSSEEANMHIQSEIDEDATMEDKDISNTAMTSTSSNDTPTTQIVTDSSTKSISDSNTLLDSLLSADKTVQSTARATIGVPGRTDLDTTNPNTNLLLNKIEIGDTTKMKRKSYVKQLIDNNHIFDWLGGGGGGGGGESSSATSSPERHTIPINDQEDEKQVQSAETQQHDNTYQTTTTNSSEEANMHIQSEIDEDATMEDKDISNTAMTSTSSNDTPTTQIVTDSSTKSISDSNTLLDSLLSADKTVQSTARATIGVPGRRPPPPPPPRTSRQSV